MGPAPRSQRLRCQLWSHSASRGRGGNQRPTRSRPGEEEQQIIGTRPLESADAPIAIRRH